MKKIGIILVAVIMLITLVGCGNNKDAVKFKEEYEELNNKENANNKKHRSVTIASDNPFIYATGDEIVKKIENKESFYVYFGSAYCPWCRSVIEKAIEVSKDKKIETIYYVDIWDGDHVEILRDTYQLNDDGEVELVTEGAKSYSKLLKYLDNVLGDYTLTNVEGESVEVGEKRIFAPNFIYIEKGKAVKLIEGISSKQKDARSKFTTAILEDEEEQFEDFFAEEN